MCDFTQRRNSMKFKKSVAMLLVAAMTFQSGMTAGYYSVPVQAETVPAPAAAAPAPVSNPAVISDGGTIIAGQYVFLKNVNGALVIAAPDENGAVLYQTDANGIPAQYTKKKRAFLNIYYNGKTEKYLVKNAKLYTGIYKKGKKKICYVSGKKYVGKMKTTRDLDNKKIKYFTYKVGKKVYAFNQKGVMYKNEIVGDDFYDSTGVRSKDKQIRQAVAFVKAHGGTKNSRSSKLRNCFYYLANRSHYSHDPDHTARLATESGLPVAADKMLRNKNSGRGNCFGWASAYAYIATVLGYEARAAKGTTRLVSGGMGPHGWTMVNYGGSWKVCDANMNYKANCYMKSYGSYPFTLGSSKTYFSLTAKDGKAVWQQL